MAAAAKVQIKRSRVPKQTKPRKDTCSKMVFHNCDTLIYDVQSRDPAGNCVHCAASVGPAGHNKVWASAVMMMMKSAKSSSAELLAEKLLTFDACFG